MIRLAVVGFGYWGPNIVRNFNRIPNVQVTWVCDVNKKAAANAITSYPTTKITTSYQDVLKDPAVDAVIVVTPTSTHFPLAREALLAGKHVLIEKPMTQTETQARQLVQLARSRQKILMVDHTFVFTPAVQKMYAIIKKGVLGKIFYVDCVRTNLGMLQKDSNVVYDLATHDFSILDYLFGTQPQTIQATGFTHLQTAQEAVAHITAHYPHGMFVHMHVGWLSPIKVRTMLFVGTKKMLLYDDMETTEKVKIYDKSISVGKNPEIRYQLAVGYRIGSTVSPHIPLREGLEGMSEAFIRAIKTGVPPKTDGATGTRVVAAVEAATKSLRKGGQSVKL